MMGTRRLPSLPFLSESDAAAIKRRARTVARFAQRRIIAPAGAFLLDSVLGLSVFIDDFVDSLEEARKAMVSAREQRYTISAHRR
ncbi:hypothetical protein CAL14_13780 [Bordetella genomosp. 9]|uniref:hypothetical protein n=1 Tax=Bordetella genomosp. 9 TaxID=1416803 RepID=UPI000A2905D6|nr:hypothetical protein [Bordetella genomosp. 9]ARP91223.1 hypothetical protein CAL14_13780 [Bordetella genomosp. 9]